MSANVEEGPPSVLILLSDEEFALIERKIEEEKVKQQNAPIEASSDSTKEVGATLLFEDMLSDQDWRTLHIMLTETLKDAQTQTARQKGMLALSMAHLHRAPNAAIKLAQEVYLESPLEGTAYVAMAQTRQGNFQSVEAQKWIGLAAKTNARDTFWFKTTHNLISKSLEAHNRLRTKILECLNDPERWDWMQKQYNISNQNPVLKELLEQIKVNNSLYDHLRETSEPLLRFTNNLLIDPCPALYYSVSVKPCPEEGGLAGVPSNIASLIGSYLNLNDHARLRQTSQSMNLRFSQPDFWRSLFNLNVADIDHIRGPIAPHEWEFFYRAYCFTIECMEFVLPLCERTRPSPSTWCSLLLPDEERVHLWKLVELYRMHQETPYHSPLSLVLGTALDLISLDGSSPSRIAHSFHAKGALIIASSCLLEQPYEQRTLEGALSLVAAYIRLPEDSLSEVFKAPLITGIRNLTLSSYRIEATAAFNTLLLGPLVDPDLSLFPIAPSPLTSLSLRKPYQVQHETLDSCNTVWNTPSSKGHVFGLCNKSDLGGTYRIHYHYHHPEIEHQRDEGILQIRFDKETGRLSGRGIDTLRGPFLVFDARSRPAIQNYEQNKRENGLEDMLNRGIRFVIQYSDGLRLGLRGTLFSYGYSGEFEHLRRPDLSDGEEEQDIEEAGAILRGPEDPNAVLGGWMMVYDHGTTLSMSSRWDELWKRTEDKEHEMIVNLRGGHRFEPWAHRDRDSQFVLSKAVIRLLSSQLQTITSHAADYSRALFLTHRRQPDAATLAKIRPMLEDLFPARLPTETERKYKLRQEIFVILTAILLEDRGRFIVAYYSKRMQAASNILSYRNHERFHSENAFWIETLNVSPFEPPYYCETIKSLYHDIIEPKEAKIPVGQAQSSAIKTLRDSFSSKKRDPNVPSRTVPVALIALTGMITVSIAAYVSYRIFYQKKTVK